MVKVPTAEKPNILVVYTGCSEWQCSKTSRSRELRLMSRVSPICEFDFIAARENTGRLLWDGQIDLVVAGHLQRNGTSPRRLLFEDQLVCIGCRSCGPSVGDVSPDTLADFEHVVVRYEQGQRSADKRALDLKTASNHRPTYVWSYMLVPHLISGFDRLAIVPKRIALKFLERWDFQLFDYPSKLVPVPAFAFWHPSRNNDVVLDRFIEMIA